MLDALDPRDAEGSDRPSVWVNGSTLELEVVETCTPADVQTQIDSVIDATHHEFERRLLEQRRVRKKHV